MKKLKPIPWWILIMLAAGILMAGWDLQWYHRVGACFAAIAIIEAPRR